MSYTLILRLTLKPIHWSQKVASLHIPAVVSILNRPQIYSMSQWHVRMAKPVPLQTVFCQIQSREKMSEKYKNIIWKVMTTTKVLFFTVPRKRDKKSMHIIDGYGSGVLCFNTLLNYYGRTTNASSIRI